jgi:hypothetical protein
MLRLRNFIDRNLHRTICISDLCAVAQRSRAHFARSFKQAFGEPPHAYVVRMRLQRACHLMVTTSASRSYIALAVGFVRSINRISAGCSDRHLAKLRRVASQMRDSERIRYGVVRCTRAETFYASLPSSRPSTADPGGGSEGCAVRSARNGSSRALG